MTNLFDVVPTQLFQPLAAPGARVYSDVLISLFEETQRHQEPLSREGVMDLVGDIIDSPEAMSSTDAVADIETVVESTDAVRTRAAAILRYLVNCKWLREETEGDFSRTYTLPSYAFRLLGIFKDIVANDSPPLQGLICAIHDLLQASVADGNAHYRVPEAYRQTVYLVNALKELQHNIGAHIEQMLRQWQASDALKQFLEDYRMQIMDTAYHQLRTSDHVSRFRPGVREALDVLERPASVEVMARGLHANGQQPSIEAAASSALRQIHDIREIFDSLDRVLQVTDARHAQFVDAAVRTVELHLSASTTTSGQVHAILSHILARPNRYNEEYLPEVFDSLIAHYSLDLVDHNSLYTSAKAGTPFSPAPLTDEPLSPQGDERVRERTRQQLQRAIGRRSVNGFMERMLKDQDTIRASEMPLERPDDLPMLIYIRQYGLDGSLGYVIDEDDEPQFVQHGMIGFVDFTVRRSGAPSQKRAPIHSLSNDKRSRPAWDKGHVQQETLL